jgi:hypothetical protein
MGMGDSQPWDKPETSQPGEGTATLKE